MTLPGHDGVNQRSVQILELAQAHQYGPEDSGGRHLRHLGHKLVTETLHHVLVLERQLVEAEETVRDLLHVQHVLVFANIKGYCLQKGDVPPSLLTQLAENQD